MQTSTGVSLRESLAARQSLFASFVIELPTRATIEAYALAGFDALILDLEHSATSLQTISLLIAACRAVGIFSIVRIEAGAIGTITRILDMAPDGVMSPGVRSVEEAAQVVGASRYYPLGRRGLAPIIRQGFAGLASPKDRDAHVAVIVQLEGAEMVGDAADVAKLDGLDMVFIGPYDLSQSLGHPGELDHSDVVLTGRQLAAEIVPHTAVGVYIEHPGQGETWHAAGTSFFALRTDGRIFLDACRDTADAWHCASSAWKAPGSAGGRSL